MGVKDGGRAQGRRTGIHGCAILDMVLKTALRRRPLRKFLNVEEPSCEDLEKVHSELGKVSPVGVS